MTDDRRERYAAAMYGPAAPHHVTAEGWELVDSVMAVADAENARLREELRTESQVSYALRKEVERLRAELARMTSDYEEARQGWTDAENREGRLQAALKAVYENMARDAKAGDEGAYEWLHEVWVQIVPREVRLLVGDDMTTD